MLKRWLAGFGIMAYLGALLFGLVAHAANFHEGSHPSMYFVVWDMFCGWSAYETRTQIVGQGVSGKYYELSPGPWGDYHPYGNISRHNYDSFNLHPDVIARNCLKHTQHEPMSRLFVVEENWAKKFNLPDAVWQQRHNEPKQPFSYFRWRTLMSPEGKVLRSQSSWLAFQHNLTITDNPRLMAETRKGQPMFHLRPMLKDTMIEPNEMISDPLSNINSPLGN